MSPEDVYEGCVVDSLPLSTHKSLPSLPIKPTRKRRRLAETNGNHSVVAKQDNIMDEDEFELWGKSVAATLRNYPNPNAVRLAKSKMNQVMASLEAGELDRQQKYNPCSRRFPTHF